jgi:hypothetical protein
MFSRTDSSSSLYKAEQSEGDEKENKKSPSDGNEENINGNGAQGDGKTTAENVVKPKLTKAKAATISVAPSRLAAAKTAMGLSKTMSRTSLKELN